MREHPITGSPRLHAGVDLGTPRGTLVRAVEAGVVRRASSDEVNGRILVIDHGRGVATLYLHNDELLVANGDRVSRGQAIAHSGNTGRSTGPHLHYQVDLAGQPVDPLQFRGERVKTAAGASD
jgi:murein DD-endopeptidase MepM/ murein hydrolase activator NlpD